MAQDASSVTRRTRLRREVGAYAAARRVAAVVQQDHGVEVLLGVGPGALVDLVAAEPACMRACTRMCMRV